MLPKLNNEGGYSLVEVMVAIMILAIAIIPMVSMFDAGLRAAVLGGSYDEARALTNEKLEEIKALPYRDPNTPGVDDSILEKYRPVNEPSVENGGLGPGTTVTGTRGKYTYEVTTRYVLPDLNTEPSPAARTSLIHVEVGVSWDRGSVSATGVKAVSL